MVTGFWRWLLRATFAVGLLALTTSAASATSVLLYDDFSVNPPADPADPASRWPTALAGLGITPTQVGTDTDFNLAMLGAWDLVVVQFDVFSHGIEPSLSTYIAGGGKVIFSNWVSDNDGAFGVTEQGTNLETLEVTLFATGLSASSFLLDGSAYTIFSRSFSEGSGIVAATFEDDFAGIVVGNGGQTIINGFVGDTLPEADEIRLYQNEVGYLVAVPEPASGTLVGLGLALVATVRHLRKRARKA